jgi:hypothetical protein
MIKSRNMRWAGCFACMVRKPEGKRPIGRPTCKWEDDILKMDLREIR